MLLDDQVAYEAMARAHNPYGEGLASRRIRDAIIQFFSKRERLTADA
jgi:UDP-N-acetylglucosamine 2-epimerase (non-hydrolysing)